MRRACYNLAYTRKNPYVFETAVFKNFIDSADFFNRRRGNRDNCFILRFAAKDSGDVFYRSKDRNSFYLSSCQFRVIVKKRAYFSENLFSFYIESMIDFSNRMIVSIVQMGAKKERGQAPFLFHSAATSTSCSSKHTGSI